MMESQSDSSNRVPLEFGRIAVLTSGGVDSSVLVAHLARSAASVAPLYVRTGMIWESAEEASLRRYLQALMMPSVGELASLDVPIASVYGEHWSTTGIGTPDAQTNDDAVYLPGRNLLLLTQPMLWCALRSIDAIAIALLRGNPFPDSSAEFFSLLEETFCTATGRKVRVVAPFREMSKEEVVRLGADLPLQWSFSCIAPVAGRHCGRCNKCEERRRGFQKAGVPDRTVYDA